MPVDRPGTIITRNLEFKLDSVFSPDADQRGVYEEVGAPQVERVLQGFNATILAYGQTGSGKTFTMYAISPVSAALHACITCQLTVTLARLHRMGPEGVSCGSGRVSNQHGIVPRAADELFRKLPLGFSVAVSYIEVYNDSVNDLLARVDGLQLRP